MGSVWLLYLVLLVCFLGLLPGIAVGVFVIGGFGDWRSVCVLVGVCLFCLVC